MHYTRRQIAALAASSLALAIAGCDSGAAPALSDLEAKARLTAFAKDLFPHKMLAPQRYQNLANSFFSSAPDVACTWARSLEVAGQSYEDLSDGVRAKLVEKHRGSDAFVAYRFHVLLGLYGDLGVTKTFGYQGPSFEDFGYIERGFNDLDWLPDPLAGEGP